MITADQFSRMHNIGIQPLPSDAAMTTFGHACYTDSPVDLLIDATCSPADRETCEDWEITPSAFHSGVVEALGRHMSEYKPPSPASETEARIYVYNTQHSEYEDLPPFRSMIQALKRIDQGIDHDVDDLANYELDVPCENVTIFFPPRHDGVFEHYLSMKPLTRTVPAKAVA